MAIVRLSVAVRNAMVDALAAAVDAGTTAGLLRVYSGAQVASVATAPAAGNVLLAEVVLADPAFAAAANGGRALVDPGPVAGKADGTAVWFRIVDALGTGVLDGDVTATGGTGTLKLNTTTISVGVDFDITGGSITMPSGE